MEIVLHTCSEFYFNWLHISSNDHSHHSIHTGLYIPNHCFDMHVVMNIVEVLYMNILLVSLQLLDASGRVIQRGWLPWVPFLTPTKRLWTRYILLAHKACTPYACLVSAPVGMLKKSISSWRKTVHHSHVSSMGDCSCLSCLCSLTLWHKEYGHTGYRWNALYRSWVFPVPLVRMVHS